MNSLFNFQYGEFSQVSPTWFDWFSLISTWIVSGLSILLAYLIAKTIYNREKNDKERELKNIQQLEVKLFNNSLIELDKALEEQIASLKKYIKEENFKLTYNQCLQVDFLQLINVKNLYMQVGFEQTSAIKKINELLSSLYAIKDFRESLRDELRMYIEKYKYHESKFYSYRKLIHSAYYDLCNKRAESFIIDNGQKKWKFYEGDTFMKEYSELLNKIFTDPSIIFDNRLIDRKKFNNEFILPLIAISDGHIPEDKQAIEVNEIGNDINNAFIDMESISDSHFTVIRAYLKNLETADKKIKEFI